MYNMKYTEKIRSQNCDGYGGQLTKKNTIGIPPASDRPYIDVYTYTNLLFSTFVCVPPDLAKAVRNLPPCDRFATSYFYRPRPEITSNSEPAYNGKRHIENNINCTLSLMLTGRVKNTDIPDNVFTLPTLRNALTAAYNNKLRIRLIRKKCGEWNDDYPVLEKR